jgi:histidyl-tRNA synthetase
VSESAAKKGEKPRKFQAIRGTRDLLPPDTALWNQVEQTAREVFGTYGFGEIRPPIFEPTELFARAVGGETDIISKEMYSFLDAPDVSDLEEAREAVKQVIPGNAAEGKQDIFELYVYNFISEVEKDIAGNQLYLSLKAQSDFSILKARYLELLAIPAVNDEDINNKRRLLTFEIIIKTDLLKFGESVTLRPEATASVCRAYIEHSMQQLPQPVKLYYMGPMFRRERPQKGRYRQFYQIGAEVLGGPDAPAIDADLIDMLMTFFAKTGLQGATLDINSIGHNAENCRRGYVEKLRAELTKVKDKLGADSQRRIDTNPLRVLDSKLEHEQPIIATLPRIADHLCDECKTHYAEVKRQLDLRGVVYKENWRLVRGLDYYMRTTFEITAPGLGSQNAVCGGGRYDGLVELLGGPPTRGIGFAIGEDRLILSLQELAKSHVEQGVGSGAAFLAARPNPFLYIAWMGQNTYATAIRAAKTLRAAGFRVELPPTELKFGKALGQADKLGARFALILGENEVASGEWTLKTLADGSQQKFSEPALLEYLRRL